jgi:hypothetical protein
LRQLTRLKQRHRGPTLFAGMLPSSYGKDIELKFVLASAIEAKEFPKYRNAIASK